MYKLGKILPRGRLHKIITHHVVKRTNEFFFVQIGSNDGIMEDPIYDYILKYKWHGILVEPIKYLFDMLIKNYKKQEGLIFVNVGISNKNESRTLYTLRKNNNLPYWVSGLGSFYLGNILKFKTLIPSIEDYIVREKVKCISFKTLIEKYSVKKIDLLCIDTEGFDYQIIKQIDFDKLKPEMIFYEHTNLSKKDKKDCERLLRKNGYKLARNSDNTLAY